ncbi:MAG: hypothetical protein ACLQIJ_22285 [Polyangia bacterium]
MMTDEELSAEIRRRSDVMRSEARAGGSTAALEAALDTLLKHVAALEVSVEALLTNNILDLEVAVGVLTKHIAALEACDGAAPLPVAPRSYFKCGVCFHEHWGGELCCEHPQACVEVIAPTENEVG